jgi:glycosyltransferase involved in cell wall biosynthesis
MPRTSVALVIAAYRRGNKIAPTLQSALQQTIKFSEILVVDDCSGDGTASWIRDNFPSVRVIEPQQNLFTAGARNFGAAAVSSVDWLMFLDHDDLLRPEALEVLLGLADAFPAAVALFADHEYVNRVTGEFYSDHHSSIPSFHRLRNVRVAARSAVGRLFARPLYHALLDGNLLQQPWMIRRDVFHSLGGFNASVRYCEDWEFYLRITGSHRIALSDTVISSHVVEMGNLHLTPGQEVIYREVLEGQLRQWPLDFSTQLPCRRRIAAYEKGRGDAEKILLNHRSAWRRYARAATYWPFDHVVLARLLLWGGAALFSSR